METHLVSQFLEVPRVQDLTRSTPTEATECIQKLNGTELLCSRDGMLIGLYVSLSNHIVRYVISVSLEVEYRLIWLRVAHSKSMH